MKLSRKSSSSYSLKLDTSKRQNTKVRRKPVSTPTSPSRSREPQCTCMTADQFNRLRAQDPRYNKERCLLFSFIYILILNYLRNIGTMCLFIFIFSFDVTAFSHTTNFTWRWTIGSRKNSCARRYVQTDHIPKLKHERQRNCHARWEIKYPRNWVTNRTGKFKLIFLII